MRVRIGDPTIEHHAEYCACGAHGHDGRFLNALQREVYIYPVYFENHITIHEGKARNDEKNDRNDNDKSAD